MNPIVIAEAGVNHNGDLEMARQLVRKAALAGADYCKFQSFRAESLVTEHAPKARYQLEGAATSETQFEMLKRLELSPEDHHVLVGECADSKIGFLSTPFDQESALLLAGLGMTTFKIPSGELTNLPFLKYLGSLGSRFFLSTGMSNLLEVEQALEALLAGGARLESVTLLHCTTQYPTPPEDINLRAMVAMAEHFHLPVGLSDHSQGLEVALAAVALGACVIEKHFTLDRGLPGPDHRASLEPEELLSLVAGCRKVSAALGDGVKRVMPSESENLAVARRSLHLARPMRQGELLRIEDVCLKRPGTGLAYQHLQTLLGRAIRGDLPENHQLSREDVL